MNMQPLRILIIDDVPTNIRMLGEVLSPECEVLFALDGPTGLDLAKKQKPDLILLDVRMPEMDGFEVCRRVREDEGLADTPVIFVTALDQEEDQLQGLELGAVDYIFKPFSAALVRLRVRNQLELKRQRDALRQRTAELEEALNRVKRLEGIIPICMYCKQIRDDRNSWQKLERYLIEHSDATFSHGICPTCYEVKMAELPMPGKKQE